MSWLSEKINEVNSKSMNIVKISKNHKMLGFWQRFREERKHLIFSSSIERLERFFNFLSEYSILKIRVSQGRPFVFSDSSSIIYSLRCDHNLQIAIFVVIFYEAKLEEQKKKKN